MKEFQEILAAEFARYRVLSIRELTLLEQHFELLLRWNEKINLTRITEVRQAVQYHYCESLYLALRLPAGSFSIADVGSGAGFPGIPIAVARPECSVALIEADSRKAVFLREASLSSPNIRVLRTRAQDAEDRFDWVVSRAVAKKELVGLTKLAAHFALLSVGDEGESVPWGARRRIEIVSRETLASCST